MISSGLFQFERILMNFYETNFLKMYLKELLLIYSKNIRKVIKKKLIDVLDVNLRERVTPFILVVQV